MFGPHEPDLDDLANSVVVLDRDDVQVTALKPAFRDDGVVVRLASFARQAVVVTLTCPSRPTQKAVLCDARERPLRELDVRDGRVVVPMPLALVSVLVWF
jgi:alpha-mannosidase